MDPRIAPKSDLEVTAFLEATKAKLRGFRACEPSLTRTNKGSTLTPTVYARRYSMKNLRSRTRGCKIVRAIMWDVCVSEG